MATMVMSNDTKARSGAVIRESRVASGVVAKPVQDLYDRQGLRDSDRRPVKDPDPVIVAGCQFTLFRCHALNA